MTEFSGAVPVRRMAYGQRRSLLRGDGEDGCALDLSVDRGVFLPSGVPIIVLTDGGCASSGEAMLSYLRSMDNVLVVGANTGGVQLCGNSMDLTLPGTGISISFGTTLFFHNAVENVDLLGYEPDLWCDGAGALDAVLALLEREGLYPSPGRFPHRCGGDRPRHHYAYGEVRRRNRGVPLELRPLNLNSSKGTPFGVPLSAL